MQTEPLIHITKCRARDVIHQHDEAKPECRWVKDGTNVAQGYSCTSCARFVDRDSQTGRAIAASFGTSRIGSDSCSEAL